MRVPAAAAATLFWASSVVAQDRSRIHQRTLANGLDVIIVENHALPIVMVDLNAKNGAFTQTADEEGLSHFYEHMFFRANRTIPGQERYLERLRELGAIPNASTWGERVRYFFTVGADSVEPALRFMEDAVRDPLFKPEELEVERAVVLGEVDLAEANPLFLLGRAGQRELWSPGYFPRKNGLGNRSVIATATPEQMRAIQQRYYVPNNMALVLAGDITAERGSALADEVFGDWLRGADPFPTPVPDPPPLERSTAVIVEQPVNTVSLWISWQGPSVRRNPRATHAADVFTEVLKNETGRFHQRIVGSGLAFQVDISHFAEDHVGQIALLARTSPEKVLPLHRAILEEVAHFADSDYVTAEQLRAARNRKAVQRTYEDERISTQAMWVGYWWAVTGLGYYLGYRAQVQRVTRADLARYASTYLVGRPHVTGLLISPAARAQAKISREALLDQALSP